MPEQNSATHGTRFGRYLRKIRESRRLSLDAVEEMTVSYHERVTKSHLSRIENGQAVPTFPRMFALSQVYGVPIACLAERFEMDLRQGARQTDLAERTVESTLEELRRLTLTGDYASAISLATAVLESDLDGVEDRASDLRLYQINGLVQLRRYETAKTECEELLSRPGFAGDRRLRALILFITCCYRLGRYPVAGMAIHAVEETLAREEHAPELLAAAHVAKGSVLYSLGMKPEAAAAFGAALEAYRVHGDRFGECKASLNLAQTRMDLGRLVEARRLIKEALAVAERQRYDKPHALALSHYAVLEYRSDNVERAEALALRSNAIARPRDYYAIVFTNCYYLRELGRKRGDSAMVSSHERTLRVYLAHVEQDLPEAVAYRTEIAGRREE